MVTDPEKLNATIQNLLSIIESNTFVLNLNPTDKENLDKAKNISDAYDRHWNT